MAVTGELKLEELQSYDDYDCLAPPASAVAPAPASGTASAPVKTEKRRSRRYPLAARGTLAVSGALLDMLTVDVSNGGVRVEVPQQVGVGMDGDIRFQFTTGDGESPVMARVRIIHCFHLGAGAYQAGLEIVQYICGREDIQRYMDAQRP